MKTRLEPARPIPNGCAQKGMTIRDELAKAALQGILANSNIGFGRDANEVAQAAINYSNALAAKLGY